MTNRARRRIEWRLRQADDLIEDALLLLPAEELRKVGDLETRLRLALLLLRTDDGPDGMPARPVGSGVHRNNTLTQWNLTTLHRQS